MKTTLLAAALLLAAVPAGAQKKAKTSGNPIFSGWYADPEGAVFGNQYWVFPTYSAPYEKQTFFDAFSSPDLAKVKEELKQNTEKKAEPVQPIQPVRPEPAQSAPAPVTTYALFRDGKFVTHAIQSDKKFLALAGK